MFECEKERGEDSSIFSTVFHDATLFVSLLYSFFRKKSTLITQKMKVITLKNIFITNVVLY